MSDALVASIEHSALRPAGVQAQHIHDLWQVALWLCAGVFAAIVCVLIVAVARSSKRSTGEPPQVSDGRERGVRRWVTGASVLSGLLLTGLLVFSISTDRAIARLSRSDALRIEMVAHQWWWETRYEAVGEDPGFAVSGDLHVPVGRPIVVTLRSADVIHTFWVPSLHGKKDMLPGRSADIVLRADQPGVYRGECAEFCGLEHALMAFTITAESPERFAAWRTAQQAPAATPRPDDVDALRGQSLFLSSHCAQCHAVRGTSAAGAVGPDLTHVATRPTLAAGTVPNERAKMAAWIVQPESLKPGSTMPSSALPPDDVRALVAYLEGLR